MIVPGIGITFRQQYYIRSYTIPYFLECCTVPYGRVDEQRWLQRRGMTYNDKFEFMLRGRAISHHSTCYVGRTEMDFVDRNRAMIDNEYYKSILSLDNETPENVFHPIDQEWYSRAMAQYAIEMERTRRLF